MKKKIGSKEQKRLFDEILSRPENKTCADCAGKGPTWCDLAFGVFVCINCSGEHRRLGQHITRIQSTRLDAWCAEDICMVEGIGNFQANGYFEYDMPKSENKPGTGASMESRRRFIKKKYVRK